MEVLWEVQLFGVHPPVIKVRENLHKGTEAGIREDGQVGSPFTVKAAVRQSHSQTYREQTNEGDTCVERSKTETMKQRACTWHFTRGTPLRAVLKPPVQTPPRQPHVGRPRRPRHSAPRSLSRPSAPQRAGGALTSSCHC
eukprot:364792-Chlamydomonas_euryale.AAC.3